MKRKDNDKDLVKSLDAQPVICMKVTSLNLKGAQECASQPQN